MGIGHFLYFFTDALSRFDVFPGFIAACVSEKGGFRAQDISDLQVRLTVVS
ncbi:MAG: hypothetical protein LBJ71_04975 [Holosporaceae bacterium]|nr:hypothetical protein [Holosporaceae bacterium]